MVRWTSKSNCATFRALVSAAPLKARFQEGDERRARDFPRSRKRGSVEGATRITVERRRRTFRALVSAAPLKGRPDRPRPDEAAAFRALVSAAPLKAAGSGLCGRGGPPFRALVSAAPLKAGRFHNDETARELS